MSESVIADQPRQFRIPVRPPSTLTLLLVYGFPACITVSLSPALVAIGQSYGLDHQAVRQVMSVALLAYALGPLFTALFSAIGGRKGTIFTGLAIAYIGFGLFIGGMYGGGYELLLAGRAVMTFGAAAAFPIAYAIISDVYYEERARGVLAVIAAAFCVVPGVVMAVSGLITEHFGWRFATFFMLAYTVLTTVLAVRLPETAAREDRGWHHILPILRAYVAVATDRVFIYCAVITGLAIAALYVYATDAALIAIDTLGLTPDIYGLYSMVPYFGAVISLTLVQRFGDRLTPRVTTLMSFVLIGLASGAMLLLFLFGEINPLVLFGATFVLIAGTMPLNVTYVTEAENTGADRAVVAAMISFLFMVASMVFVQVSGWMEMLLGSLGYPATLLIILGGLVVTFLAMVRDPRVTFL